MGNFYTSYTLRGPSQESVAAVLAGRSTFVTSANKGCVCAYDEESEGQNTEVISELASRLSGQLRCPLLAVMNHDDSILWYQLYQDGGLIDEYISAPGYFESDNETLAMAGPDGGDAKKLCATFGSNAVDNVEKILRTPGAVDGGYVFEVERHADLVRALGIPDFGTGGYEQISQEELPHGLPEDDWIKTKDLAPGPPLEDIWRRPLPGYYKVSFRTNPKLTKSIPSCWMPGLWAELECQESGLSEAFHKAAALHREKFKRLGFTEVGFRKLKRILNPNARDMGSIKFLNRSRQYFGQLIYNRSFIPSLQAEREGLVFAFSASLSNETFSCSNNADPFEPVPNHNVKRVKSDDVDFIFGEFVQHLGQLSETPREFPDLKSLQTWVDANATEMFEFRVRRGTWVRMSEYEVERFLRKPR